MTATWGPLTKAHSSWSLPVSSPEETPGLRDLRSPQPAKLISTTESSGQAELNVELASSASTTRPSLSFVGRRRPAPRRVAPHHNVSVSRRPRVAASDSSTTLRLYAKPASTSPPAWSRGALSASTSATSSTATAAYTAGPNTSGCRCGHRKSAGHTRSTRRSPTAAPSCSATGGSRHEAPCSGRARAVAQLHSA
jgi:hypothetical protein